MAKTTIIKNNLKKKLKITAKIKTNGKN